MQHLRPSITKIFLEGIRHVADLSGLNGTKIDMRHYEREEDLQLSKELVA